MKNALQAYMDLNGYSLSRAAEEIGINKGTLSRFLNMKREPDVQTAVLMCHWMERSIQEFVREEFRD